MDDNVRRRDGRLVHHLFSFTNACPIFSDYFLSFLSGFYVCDLCAADKRESDTHIRSIYPPFSCDDSRPSSRRIATRAENEEKRLQCHWINERFHLFGASVNALAAVSAATEAALRLETQITLFQIYSDEHDRWEQCKCNPTKEFRLLVFGNSNWIRINEIRSKSRLVICSSICMQENDDMLRAQRQTEYAYENRFFFLSEWLL